MPPGALHHIIVRRIDRSLIFKDDIDRNNFLDRLGGIIQETRTHCFAWALIPNHFHLLLKTGTVPIAALMRRLLTGHAVTFNRRHRRAGHLFQNRYKSILCQQEPYLLEQMKKRYDLITKGYDIDKIASRVSELMMIDPSDIWAPGKEPARVKARRRGLTHTNNLPAQK